MSADMGDGDLADPDAAGMTDAEAAAPSPGAAASAVGSDTDSDSDAPERASEIDDITAAIPRLEDIAEIDVLTVMAERDEYTKLAQRIQADFDNFRKRSAVQARDEADRAAGHLASALLPVLDAAEAAYLNHPDEVGPLLNQMLGELKRHGLEALDLEGQPFDPEVAEAVAHEPGDGGDPVVTEVLRSGYRWKGRTLRPAMVRTSD
ncbi:MAG: nucleotide exchange factor GrpE [Acidimicrobiia bacterium]|nr:nucleotide exchange factor GrpE [Acidimicrobiia bacterium]